MTIRPATIADAAAIAQVQIEGWRTTYRGIIGDDCLDELSQESRTAAWREQLNGPPMITLVVEDGAQGVVAFASGGPERTGRDDFRGELYAIYMLEPYRRQGIGRRLFFRVAARLNKAGMDSILVWVLADNPYRRFYEALGARVVAEQEIEIGGSQLKELAYGWDHIQPDERGA